MKKEVNFDQLREVKVIDPLTTFNLENIKSVSGSSNTNRDSLYFKRCTSR